MDKRVLVAVATLFILIGYSNCGQVGFDGGSQQSVVVPLTPESENSPSSEEPGLTLNLDLIQLTSLSNATFPEIIDNGIFQASTSDCSFLLVDSQGNSVCVGTSRFGNSYFEMNSGDIDIIAYKVSPTGELLWTRQFGETSAPEANRGEQVRAASLDSQDNIVIAGVTYSDHFAEDRSGTGDSYILKLSPDGDLMWIKQFGQDTAPASLANTHDTITQVLTNSNGDIFFSGDFREPGPGTSSEVFIGKLNTQGQEQWFKVLEASQENLILNSDGDEYVSGLLMNSNESHLFLTGITDGDLARVKNPSENKNIYAMRFNPNNGEIQKISQRKTQEIDSLSFNPLSIFSTKWVDNQLVLMLHSRHLGEQSNSSDDVDRRSIISLDSDLSENWIYLIEVDGVFAYISQALAEQNRILLIERTSTFIGPEHTGDFQFSILNSDGNRILKGVIPIRDRENQGFFTGSFYENGPEIALTALTYQLGNTSLNRNNNLYRFRISVDEP